MKKVLSLVLALTMVFAFTLTFTGCGGSDSGDEGNSDSAMKAGFICLHDENSTYDKNFIDAANAACEELGIEAIIKTNNATMQQLNWLTQDAESYLLTHSVMRTT